jgi:hypothetical protein
MSLLLVNLLIVYIVVPAQCTPLNKLWDFTNSVEGSCIDTNAFYHGQPHLIPILALYLAHNL